MAVLSRFAPPLALMGVIFFLSAQPNLATDLGVWDTILRKLAHMVSYGLLWFLWWRALGYGSPVPAVAIALAYAITDEWHQSFVEGRNGSPIDVLIDATGMAMAIGFAVLRTRRQALWGSGRAAGSRDRRGRAGDSAPARTPPRA